MIAIPQPGGPQARVVATDPAGVLRERGAVLSQAVQRARSGRDPGAIHDLRVAARRLESVLDVWRAVLPAKARRKLRGAARRLRRRAGPARELEVDLELVSARLAGGPQAQGPAGAWLEALRVRRDEARSAFAAVAAHTRLGRLARRLRAMAPPPDALAIPGAREAALERIGRRQRRALAALATGRADGDDASLHAARIAVKKWRYATEALATGEIYAVSVRARELRAWQRELGAIHDLAMLRGLLRSEAGRALREGGDALAATLARALPPLEHERARALARLRAMDAPAGAAPSPRG